MQETTNDDDFLAEMLVREPLEEPHTVEVASIEDSAASPATWTSEAADPGGMDILPTAVLSNKKPIGRPSVIAPKGIKPVSILVDMSLEDREQFKAYCEARGLKMAAVVRGMIQEINKRHHNTPKEIRRERFEAWVERNKNVAGFSLEKALATFRKLEAAQEEAEALAEEAEWVDQEKAL